MDRSRLQHARRLASANRPREAEQICRQILTAQPNDANTQRLLGTLTRANGKPAESVRIFSRLRRVRPKELRLAGELGASLVAAGEYARALAPLRQAAEAMPGVAEWRLWLGRCLLGLGRAQGAVRALERARDLEPESPAILFHLADALQLAVRLPRAEEIIRHHLELAPGSRPGRLLLANILERSNRFDEEEQIIREVLEEEPGFEPALAGLAQCLRRQGQYDEALRTLQPLLAAEPTPERALAAAPVLTAVGGHERCAALIERALDRPGISAPAASTLLFHLGRAREALGDYDRAFEAFTQANGLAPGAPNPADAAQRHREIRAAFDPGSVHSGPIASLDAGRCVFIVGMPRSGTSLLEQILGSHPRVHGAGELPALPAVAAEMRGQNGLPYPACVGDAREEDFDRAGAEYLRRVQALTDDPGALVVDKLPHNFELLGLIARALPGAKIIHAVRDPVDTCLSCYTTELSAWHHETQDLRSLGRAYARYLELMRFWRDDCGIEMLEVRYEAVTADVGAQARRVVAYLGLEWDPRCLRFHSNARSVGTASVDQVRRPIYTSSVRRWRRYERHLGPLLETLGQCGVPLDSAVDPASR